MDKVARWHKGLSRISCVVLIVTPMSASLNRNLGRAKRSSRRDRNILQSMYYLRLLACRLRSRNICCFSTLIPGFCPNIWLDRDDLSQPCKEGYSFYRNWPYVVKMRGLYTSTWIHNKKTGFSCTQKYRWFPFRIKYSKQLALRTTSKTAVKIGSAGWRLRNLHQLGI